MADNVNITPGSGETIASDDVDGVQFQKMKINLGGDGVEGDLWSGKVEPVDPNGNNPLNLSQAGYYDSTTAGLDSIAVGSFNQLYNGSSWDRQRGNYSFTSLESEARTSTISTSDYTNYNSKGVLIILNVSATSDTPSITLSVEAKDEISNSYVSLLTGSAVTSTGTYSYMVYPGAGTAADDITKVAPFGLPRIWRINVEHDDSDSITYSVFVTYLS